MSFYVLPPVWFMLSLISGGSHLDRQWGTLSLGRCSTVKASAKLVPLRSSTHMFSDPLPTSLYIYLRAESNREIVSCRAMPSLSPFAQGGLPFSLSISSESRLHRSEPEVESKWRRSEVKWHRSTIEVVERKSNSIELKSMWIQLNRNEIKAHRSELGVNASELAVKSNQTELKSKWHRSGIKWHRSEINV